MRAAIDPGHNVTLRTARPEDAPALAQLAGQLGYPSSSDQVARRISQILDRPDHAVFVAEVAQQAGPALVVGWVHGSVHRTIESDTTAEVLGLVVDAAHRGLGIGQLLMDRLDQWARAAGCETITVRSNVIRERAHAFYQRLGFSIVKTQKVFRKAVKA